MLETALKSSDLKTTRKHEIDTSYNLINVILTKCLIWYINVCTVRILNHITVDSSITCMNLVFRKSSHQHDTN